MAAAAPISTRSPSLGSDDFRIEFGDDVLPPPVSRLSVEADDDEEDFETRLQATQEELLQLKHQARLVERRKEELEELNRKERAFTQGRADIHERLTRVLVTIDRETMEARRRLEIFLQAKQDLSRHYQAVTAIRPERWERAEIHDHLDHALAILGDARLDYDRTMTQVEPLLPVTPSKSSDTPSAPAISLLPRDFGYWLRAGFAFTLPLTLLGLAAVVLNSVF